MGDDIVQDAQAERLVVSMMIKEDLNAVQLAALVADRGGVTAQPRQLAQHTVDFWILRLRGGRKNYLRSEDVKE